MYNVFCINSRCIIMIMNIQRSADFDHVEDKYIAISINYRGDVKAKEANATAQWLKTNK